MSILCLSSEHLHLLGQTQRSFSYAVLSVLNTLPCRFGSSSTLSVSSFKLQSLSEISPFQTFILTLYVYMWTLVSLHGCHFDQFDVSLKFTQAVPNPWTKLQLNLVKISQHISALSEVRESLLASVCFGWSFVQDRFLVCRIQCKLSWLHFFQANKQMH